MMVEVYQGEISKRYDVKALVGKYDVSNTRMMCSKSYNKAVRRESNTILK